MSCGSWCVYYTSRNTTSNGLCRNCGDYTDEHKARFELGKVDIFELARLLKEKEQKQK